MSNILVCKSKDKIIISNFGKKLIIKKDDENFEKLDVLTKGDIIKWYLEGR